MDGAGPNAPRSARLVTEFGLNESEGAHVNTAPSPAHPASDSAHQPAIALNLAARHRPPATGRPPGRHPQPHRDRQSVRSATRRQILRYENTRTRTRTRLSFHSGWQSSRRPTRTANRAGPAKSEATTGRAVRGTAAPGKGFIRQSGRGQSPPGIVHVPAPHLPEPISAAVADPAGSDHVDTEGRSDVYFRAAASEPVSARAPMRQEN